MKDGVILSAVRTGIGGFLGQYRELSAPRLAAVCIKEAVRRAEIKPEKIDECLMGCVLTAGIGQAPARQAAIFAGLPHSVCCTTINRVCGSGLKAVMLAIQMIRCGDAEIVVAGGMESMSQAPFLLDRAREGYRLGNGKLIDSLVHDGLWDVYHQFHMGDAAEFCAKECRISRQQQDRYAELSYRRALDAVSTGKFKKEIVPVAVEEGRSQKSIESDEEPLKAKLDKFGELKPVFQQNGTVTAANASSLSDGASAIVMSSQEFAKANSLRPIARILGQASHAQAPEWFTTAPVGAIRKLLQKTNLPIDRVDLFEINEAFAVVAIACMRELELDENRVNIRGGAVAMGHPIGATGARLLTTLIHALEAEKKRYGVVAMCIGGGEASALLIERIT